MKKLQCKYTDRLLPNQPSPITAMDNATRDLYVRLGEKTPIVVDEKYSSLPRRYTQRPLPHISVRLQPISIVG